MKHLLTLFFCLSLPLPASAALKVFACEPEWAALTQELGGDSVTLYTATSGLQDPHYIQARPSLIAKLRRADLLVCTGAGLESGWLPVLLRRSANPRVQPGQPGYFMAADYIQLLDRPVELDRSKGDIHAEGDPHFITDPHSFLPIAQALTQRLQQLEPQQKGSYQQRMLHFEQRWQQALQRWQQQAQPLKGIAVISQHKSWSYLLQWLEIKEVVRLEAKPGIPPSTAHLQKVLLQIKQQPVAMVLRASYQDDTPAQWLQQQTGIPEVVLPYTVGGNSRATDLFSLFDDTLARLLSALKRE